MKSVTEMFQINDVWFTEKEITLARYIAEQFGYAVTVEKIIGGYRDVVAMNFTPSSGSRPPHEVDLDALLNASLLRAAQKA